MAELLPLPDTLSCRLSIKNGDPFEPCRDKVPPSPFLFAVADGYRVLRAKEEELFASKLPGQWRSECDIYVKPSNHAKQKQFEVVFQEAVAMRVQVEEIWHWARRRHNGHAGFELELFVYIPKPEAKTTMHRATAARI